VGTIEDQKEAVWSGRERFQLRPQRRLFSNDHERALTLARKMRTGRVLLNNHPIGFKSPFGGFKDSGIGRAAGIEGMNAYVETKSIGLTPDLLAKLS
jgi:aldehyde dehydrogenase (NAD+)